MYIYCCSKVGNMWILSSGLCFDCQFKGSHFRFPWVIFQKSLKEHLDGIKVKLHIPYPKLTSLESWYRCLWIDNVLNSFHFIVLKVFYNTEYLSQLHLMRLYKLFLKPDMALLIDSDAIFYTRVVFLYTNYCDVIIIIRI